MNSNWRTYSLLDVHVVFNHPDVGQLIVQEEGGGEIGFTYSGDMSSHTPTATGYVVINRMKAKNGQLSLQIPQNSNADLFLSKWINYIKNIDNSERFALATITITDNNCGKTYNMFGVTPQKEPDKSFNREASMKTYNLLFAEYTEQ